MEQKTILWDLEHSRKLRETRGVSFEYINTLIEAGSYNIVEHPTRKNQQVVVVVICGYPWDVPFVVQEDGSLFLKTAFPNRKRKKQ